MDDTASFDLRSRQGGALYKGAAVGLLLGLAGWIPSAVYFIRGGSTPLAGVIVVAVLCTGFLLLGTVLLISSIQVTRAGPDTLYVESDGLARTSRTGGFTLPWSEIGRLDVVATQAIAGYDPYTPGNTGTRRSGGQTALRIQPVEPARFATRYPSLDTRAAPAVAQRLIGAPFGLVFTMSEAQRSALAAAIARRLGQRFGGVVDETAGGLRRDA